MPRGPPGYEYPEGADRRALSLCEGKTPWTSAKSSKCAATPHNESLYIKSKMLSSTFQVVVPQQVEDAPEIMERQFVPFQECLLAGVRISAVERSRAPHAAQTEDLYFLPLASQFRNHLVPVHLAFLPTRV